MEFPRHGSRYCGLTVPKTVPVSARKNRATIRLFLDALGRIRARAGAHVCATSGRIMRRECPTPPGVDSRELRP